MQPSSNMHTTIYHCHKHTSFFKKTADELHKLFMCTNIYLWAHTRLRFAILFYFICVQKLCAKWTMVDQCSHTQNILTIKNAVTHTDNSTCLHRLTTVVPSVAYNTICSVNNSVTNLFQLSAAKATVIAAIAECIKKTCV